MKMWSRRLAGPVALAAGLGVASLTAKASSPPPASAETPKGKAPAPAARVYRVAAIGDSLTDPKARGGLYLRYLKERCPESRFDSFGRGGDMVNQMRRRFERDVYGGAPAGGEPPYTHVIVFGGVNDVYSDLTAKRTVEKITTDLAAMYAAARAHGARAVGVTITPWGGFKRYFNATRAANTAELNRWILAQPAAGTSDHAVDAYPLLACGNRICDELAEPFRDGLHFGPAGHRRIAEALHAGVFRDCK
jgi:lysophospholipase L1-like esterase